LSRLRSATSRWSRASSCSNPLRRLASSAFLPPDWFRQRWQVCSLTPGFWQDLLGEPLGRVPTWLIYVVVILPTLWLLPGVVGILERLEEREDVVVALLTGNWEPGSKAKLRG